MAKKAVSKRKAGKAKGEKRTPTKERKPAPKAKGGKAKAGKRVQSPRSVALPGMEQATNQRLNNLCEGIGDERRAKALADKEEATLVSGALQEMVRKGIVQYHHAGVELVRVQGAEKLRVHVTKEKTATANQGGGPSDAGDQDQDEQQEQQNEENRSHDEGIDEGDLDGGDEDGGNVGEID